MVFEIFLVLLVVGAYFTIKAKQPNHAQCTEQKHKGYDQFVNWCRNFVEDFKWLQAFGFGLLIRVVMYNPIKMTRKSTADNTV